MSFGIQTWDAKGNPNNYGLVPVSVLGYFSVATGQKSGGATYDVPAGFALDFLVINSGDTYTQARRRVVASGSSISISSAADNDFGANTYPALAGFIIAFVRAE